MNEKENEHDRAFTIVPFSSLNPSGKERVKSESWMVHDDGFVSKKSNLMLVKGRVEFSINAVHGLVRRARLANAIEGVA
jgi:hypothetical protein